jgi:hypothetical protein
MNTDASRARMARPSQELAEQEQAALRRVAAEMTAEAAELPPTSWVAVHLRLGVEGWGERVLPELFSLMAAEDADQPAQSWIRVRSDHCPLTLAEEASLRRVSAILQAEGAELGPTSQVGSRLNSWGIRLALECERPSGMRRI